MKKTWAAWALSAVACTAQAGDFYFGGQYGSAGLYNEVTTTSVGLGRVFGGYRLNDIVALELGYSQLDTANHVEHGLLAGNHFVAETALNMDGMDLGAIVSPFSSLRGLYFRAGVTEYATKFSWAGHYNGRLTRSDSHTFGGLGTMFGVGYDWKVGPGAVRFELNQLLSISDLRDYDATTYSVGYLYAF